MSQSMSKAVESGCAAQDGRAFRRCLGQYPTGVAVITASHEGRQVGMAVNSFAAVSLDPPLVLWSIRRESGSADAFLSASHFAVNVLAAEQVEVSQRFGASHPERFSQSQWTAGAGQAPLLDGAIAHLECRRSDVYDGGDHYILIGEVQRYSRFEGQPLLFAQGQYAVARNHPGLAGDGALAIASGNAAHSGEQSFLRMLSSASQRLSTGFDAHRREFGVTAASGRVLSRLAVGPLTRAELEHATLLSGEALDDAVRELRCAQLLVQSGEHRLALTSTGQAKRQELAQRADAFTQEKLAGIDATDVAAARRVMAALQQR